jgi:dihydrofolate reductase
MKNVTLITAMSNNRCIGQENKLPWRQREDLIHFKNVTKNCAVIMGRKTFESLGEVALPNRMNIVLSRNTVSGFEDDVVYTNTLEKAIEISESMGLESIIIGGSEIYNLALPVVTKMYITMINTEVDGDAFFPEFNYNDWNQKVLNSGSANLKNDFDYTIYLMEKK